MHGKSVPLIRQMGTTDCGIACLTMLFQYYGFNIDIIYFGIKFVLINANTCFSAGKCRKY